MKKILTVSKIAIAVFLVMTVLKGGQPCPAVDPLDHMVLLSNPNDCSGFIMCSNGVPILQKCPEGLHFNANINVCDWPQNAGCESTVITVGGGEGNGNSGDAYTKRRSRCRMEVNGTFTIEREIIECDPGGLYNCTPSCLSRTLDQYGVATSGWRNC